jgi:hypothetical protein
VGKGNGRALHAPTNMRDWDIERLFWNGGKRVREDTTESPTQGVSQRDRSQLLQGLFFLVYLGLFAILIYLMRWLGQTLVLHVSGLDFLLLCLATFRLTHIVNEEKVAQFIRAPFVTCKAVMQPDGGQTKEEKPFGSGIRRMIGELLLCPWCSGVWIATLLVFFHVLVPRVAHVFTLAFATAAGAVLLGTLAKLMHRIRQPLPKP